ncbi:MAG: hypothetical protein H0W88_09170 [Parachlamydiaceae bacterium]|nr:hypothetical protein [Parachlamydiaceae bacterium]
MTWASNIYNRICGNKNYSQLQNAEQEDVGDVIDQTELAEKLKDITLDTLSKKVHGKLISKRIETMKKKAKAPEKQPENKPKSLSEKVASITTQNYPKEIKLSNGTTTSVDFIERQVLMLDIIVNRILLDSAGSVLKDYNDPYVQIDQEAKEKPKGDAGKKVDSGVGLSIKIDVPGDKSKVKGEKIDKTAEKDCPAKKTPPSKSIIEESTWKDLELLNGEQFDENGNRVVETDKEGKPIENAQIIKASVASNLCEGKVKTKIGEIGFRQRLANPTSDLEVLKKRQQLVTLLSDSKAGGIRRKINKELNILAENELHLLSFWQVKDQLLVGRADRFFFRYVESLDKWLNKTKFAVTMHGGLEKVNTRLRTLIKTVAVVAMPLIALNAMGAFNKYPEFSENLDTVGQRFTATAGPIFFIASFLQNKTIKAISNLWGWCVAASTVAKDWGWQKAEAEYCELIHEKTLAISKYYKSMKTIHKILSNKDNTGLADNLEQYKKFDDFIKNPKLKTLFGALNSRSFDCDTPTEYNQMGNIMVAWMELQDAGIRTEFEKGLHAIAEIDTVLTTVSLVTTSKDKPKAKFCVANFVPGDEPMIHLENYWHPMVKEEKLVTNSIKLGKDGDARNIIVTGSNTGGKSTALRSISTSVVMAQSLGIAPAESMTLTAFDKVKSSMTTKDDVQKGDSLFQGQVKFVDKSIKELRELDKTKQKSLFIVDEMFNGTSEKSGKPHAKGSARIMGKFRNNITIFATHFSNVPTLEKQTNGMYKNYCVGTDASNTPDYKLKPGIGTLDPAKGVKEKLNLDKEVSDAIDEETTELEFEMVAKELSKQDETTIIQSHQKLTDMLTRKDLPEDVRKELEETIKLMGSVGAVSKKHLKKEKVSKPTMAETMSAASGMGLGLSGSSIVDPHASVRRLSRELEDLCFSESNGYSMAYDNSGLETKTG